MTSTVLIPAYNAAEFIRGTIDSVYGQTSPDWRLIISVDPSDDDTLAICRSYETDARVTVHAQPERLGWVGNYNYLLRQVETPFFAILFHDDLWEPRFLEAMRALLEAHTEAVFGFCAVEVFGLKSRLSEARDIQGPLERRLTEYLSGPYHVLPIKALMRKQAVDRGFSIPVARHDGFSADRLAMLILFNLGEGVYLPEPLYRKHVGRPSVVRGWEKWSREEKRDAWAEHIAVARRLFDEMDLQPEARERIFEVFVRQTLDFPAIWSPWRTPHSRSRAESARPEKASKRKSAAKTKPAPRKAHWASWPGIVRPSTAFQRLRRHRWVSRVKGGLTGYLRRLGWRKERRWTS